MKRAEREAKEGVVYALVSDDQKKGVIVKLSCETDFVAKNEDFVNLTKRMAEIALATMPSDRDGLLGQSIDGITIEEKVVEQVGKIGEKIELAAYEYIEAPLVTSYIHMGFKAGVLVGLNVGNESYVDAGRDVAMQIAAMRPVAVDKSGVDPSIIEKEIEIGKDQARQEGKPEELLEKIALGKLNKFYKESTLLAQAFVKDNKMSVEQYLKQIDKNLTVEGFRHVELG